MKTPSYNRFISFKELSYVDRMCRLTYDRLVYLSALRVVAVALLSMTTGRGYHTVEPGNSGNPRADVTESPINTPPKPTANNSQTAAIGVTFSYTVNAFTDSETPNSLTYSATINPVNGLSFDAPTRILSGKPDKGATSQVTITVTDPGGLSASTSFTISVPCSSHPDYAALTDLYNATDGPNWTTKTNWFSNCSPCNWYGITCRAGGRVEEISLSNNQLKGTLPSSISALSLARLNLSNNQLSGAIPASLGKLTNLQLLSLFNNQLSGPIPTELGNIPNLEELLLFNNQLTGSIPASLGSLVYLKSLFLNWNQLSGPIPASLGTIDNLQSLGLSYNRISGPIPDNLGEMLNLNNLALDHNQLSGPIPENIGYYAYNYYTINLSYNQLTGSIPDSLGMGRLSESLHTLRLNNNQLTGGVPASLGNLTNLEDLRIDHNQLSGCFPASLSALCGRTVDFSNNLNLPGGGNFALFCANGTGQCLTQPDLTPILYARPMTLDGVNGISVVVSVIELNEIATHGPVTLKLTKDASLNLLFPANESVIGGRLVTNNAWTFSDADPNYYVLTSKQTLTAGGNLSVGLSGKFNPGTTTGSLTISAVLVNIADEYRVTNNTDADKIEYFGQ